MTNTPSPVGHIDPETLGESWVVVFGGLSRQGNRRARRAVSNALVAGMGVVWFDGFEETYAESAQRVPLDVDVDPIGLSIVGFKSAEEDQLAGRLAIGGGWQRTRFTRAIWRHILRRVGTVLRSRSAWLSVREDVRALAKVSAPLAVLFCDDTSITSAWYAGCLWPTAKIKSTLDNVTT